MFALDFLRAMTSQPLLHEHNLQGRHDTRTFSRPEASASPRGTATNSQMADVAEANPRPAKFCQRFGCQFRQIHTFTQVILVVSFELKNQTDLWQSIELAQLDPEGNQPGAGEECRQVPAWEEPEPCFSSPRETSLWEGLLRGPSSSGCQLRGRLQSVAKEAGDGTEGRSETRVFSCEFHVIVSECFKHNLRHTIASGRFSEQGDATVELSSSSFAVRLHFWLVKSKAFLGNNMETICHARVSLRFGCRQPLKAGRQAQDAEATDGEAYSDDEAALRQCRCEHIVLYPEEFYDDESDAESAVLSRATCFLQIERFQLWK